MGKVKSNKSENVNLKKIEHFIPDRKLAKLIEKFILFLDYCVEEDLLLDDNSCMIHDYIFDNAADFGRVPNLKKRLKKIINYDFTELLKTLEVSPSLFNLATTSLPYFIKKLHKLLLDKPIIVPKINESEVAVASIFEGLKYTSNNDSSYKNNPSYYTLSKRHKKYG